MKKKIFGGVVILAMAMVNVNLGFNENNMAELSLANVEALAQTESLPYPVYIVTVYSPYSWKCDAGGSLHCPS